MKKILSIFAALSLAMASHAATFNVTSTDATVSGDGQKITFSGTGIVNSENKLINIMVWGGSLTESADYASPDVYGTIGMVDVEGSGSIVVDDEKIRLTATLKDYSKTNTYNLTITKYLKRSLTLTHMSITPGDAASGSTYQFEAIGDHVIKGALISLANATDYNGTFTAADINKDNSAIIFANGNIVTFVSGSITIATADAKTTLHAELTGSDGVAYTIDMATPDFTLTSTTLRISEQEGGINKVATGHSETGNITLYFYNGVKKGYGEYTYTTDTIVEDIVAPIFGIIGKVSVEGTGTYVYDEELQSDYIKTTLIGSDNKTYLLTMYNAPKDTIEVICKDMETEDVTTRLGQRFLLLTGTSSIGKLELQIFGYTGEYGEYGWIDAKSAATSGEINGVWAQGVGVWSHSNELNSDLLEAVLVSEDGENIYKVTMYHAATTDVENIVLETLATKFIQNGQIYIIKEGIKYDILGAEVK